MHGVVPAPGQFVDVLVQPWWQDDRWQAAILSCASSKPIISIVDPWNELQAPPTEVYILDCVGTLHY